MISVRRGDISDQDYSCRLVHKRQNNRNQDYKSRIPETFPLTL